MEYLYTPRYCYISPLCFTAQRRLEVHDLQGPLGPIEPVPVLARLDPLLQTPIQLTDEEFSQLVDFVRHGLLDPRILPAHLKALVPKRVPSGPPNARLRVRVGDPQSIACQRSLYGVPPSRGREHSVEPNRRTYLSLAYLL
jgi:hypothetical protein